MDRLVSYAQNREDIFLHVLLHKKKKGFYVDVGAYDETSHSVTKFFYQRGWSGINVEPIKSLYAGYKTKRKRDINLNTAISNKKGHLTFREYPHHAGLSTFSDAIKKEHEAQNLPHEDYKVPVTTLKSVFKENKVKEIDFLKIDVEGHEMEVLEGNDWDRYRPAVVVLEGAYKDLFLPFMKDRKYHEIFFDGLNYYLVANERTDINMYQYPSIVLSYGYVTPAEMRLAEQHQGVLEEIKRLEAKLEEIPPVRKATKLLSQSLKRSFKARTQQLLKPNREDAEN